MVEHANGNGSFYGDALRPFGRTNSTWDTKYFIDRGDPKKLLPRITEVIKPRPNLDGRTLVVQNVTSRAGARLTLVSTPRVVEYFVPKLDDIPGLPSSDATFSVTLLVGNQPKEFQVLAKNSSSAETQVRRLARKSNEEMPAGRCIVRAISPRDFVRIVKKRMEEEGGDYPGHVAMYAGIREHKLKLLEAAGF